MTLLDRAFDAFEEGRFELAKHICLDIIKNSPKAAGAHYLLGSILGLQDHHDEAVASLLEAKRLAPNNSKVTVNLAIILQKSGRSNEALKHIQQLEPMHLQSEDIRALEASLQLDLGDANAALASADIALDIKPSFVPALVAKGNTLARMERYEEALSVYERALASEPDVTILTNKAKVLYNWGRLEDALNAYDAVLLSSPSDIEALTGKALTLCELDRAHEALQVSRTAINVYPSSQEALLAHALSLHKGKRNWKAKEVVETLLGNKPEARAFVLYAQILSDLSFHNEAIDACTKAIALNRTDHAAVLQKGLIQLLTGNFEQGWSNYEARLLVKSNVNKSMGHQAQFLDHAHLKPELTAVAGKRLLIMEEQGIGDTIMFASLIPNLLEICSCLDVVVQKRLITLMRRSFPSVAFHELESFHDERISSYDCFLMMGSLPHIFRKDQSRFGKKAFIKPDPLKAEIWRQRVSCNGKPVIGVSWKGGTRATNTRRRSLPLASFEPLFKEDSFHFVSLQHEAAINELTPTIVPSRFQMFSESDIYDIDDLTALISVLDGVVTVQNTNVHICGALGKRCSVIIPSIPEWRYGINGNRMNWYTSPRLWRLRNDDTLSTMQQISEELKRDIL